MNPIVSIVLPVYNCPQYVGAAIESMLAQTWCDYELIIIDDGSRDETPEVLRRYHDPRIRLYGQTNRGLAATLNRGIELAQGKYIARQDQDDVSLPKRLAMQVAHLDANPACALVGTWAEIWRDGSRTGQLHRHPCDNSTLKFELLLNNPFVHSSMMIRRAALDRVGVYSTDAARQPPEDYELWSRIAREYEVANIAEVLHMYREVEGSMSREGPSPFMEHLVTICAENIAWAADVARDEPQVTNIAALAHRAESRLRGTPDFAAMKRIFRSAAERIVAPADRTRFAAEAVRRIDTLRYRQMELRHLAGWRRRLVQLAGRAARVMRRG